MSYDIGINFRVTSGFVTDGASETYCNADAYPTTRGGVTFGWEDSGGQARDRSSGVDRRLAGINFQTASGKRFRIDLPGSGAADIHCAVGDEGATNNGDWDFRDGTTSLFSLSGVLPSSGRYKDPNANVWTTAQWPGSETSKTVTFSGTIFRVVSNSASTNVIAHVRVKQTASQDTPELYGLSGLRSQQQMQQLLAQ